eukprot:TRINITY_DN6442_c0_g1_i3.p3 TRINITY_DN6442_c0_g1~~TRINITY_DN6442_c0_g1_i3.p3  ORF type:complete len:122 (-),score=28.92 TRINITY_DN6442_c0_g1_i3:117-482(-)
MCIRDRVSTQSTWEVDYFKLKEILQVAKTVQNIDNELITNIFTEEYAKDRMLIDDSDIDEGYIRITGSHYGKIAIAPAIASRIENTLTKNMNMIKKRDYICLLYTSPSPRDLSTSRMPSSA